MTVRFDSIRTPLGPFTYAVRDDVVVWSGFETEPPVAARRAPDPGSFRSRIEAYFDGDATAIDGLPVELHGTAYQRAAWRALRAIPAGRTITYGELARAVGRPGSARAAGSACGRNPVAVIVPCHRVLAAGDRAGGYGYGLERKRWLLDLEAPRR